MSAPWLILDCHYICHRAFHTAKNLSWKGISTGVVFGFLKSITSLKDEFQTDRVVFCFEHPHLFRRDVYPEYKRRRNTKERTEEEKKSYESLVIQISELRRRYLPKIGFKNVFSFRGMESDDIMAAVAMNLPKGDSAIIITADHDLYQCLGPNVEMFPPQSFKVLTEDWFIGHYGIRPSQWAVVKAIAGCPSDEVKGVPGVGEKTALKFVKGELVKTSKAYQAIVSAEGRAIVRRNRALVQLPFKGCPVPDLQEDRISRKQWQEVCADLGMKSIASHPPISTRKLISNVKRV